MTGPPVWYHSESGTCTKENDETMGRDAGTPLNERMGVETSPNRGRVCILGCEVGIHCQSLHLVPFREPRTQ